MEYERNGVAHLLTFYAPFENWRRIDSADNHAAEQWAQGVRRLVVQEDYPQATHITLVMDNLNTHSGTPLCEFSVLGRQCLDRRLPDLATVASEVQTWTETRNQSNQPVDWRFTTEDARIKLKGSSSNAFILYYQIDELLEWNPQAILPILITNGIYLIISPDSSGERSDLEPPVLAATQEGTTINTDEWGTYRYLSAAERQHVISRGYPGFSADFV